MLTRSDSAGYRRPPKSRRFRRGKSGNPKGRPPGSKNFEKVLAAALHDRVQVTKNGRHKTISKLEAALTQLMNQAASGDIKAIQTLLKQVVHGAEGEHASGSLDVFNTRESHIVMADIVRRIRSMEEPANDPDDAEAGEKGASTQRRSRRRQK
jgi:hypothetical protein